MTEEIKEQAEEQTAEKPKPKGLPDDQEWDHVEFNEQQQRRFNRVFAEMKSQREIIAEMGKQNRALLDKLGEVEKRGAEKETADRRDAIRAKITEAYNDGDMEAVGKLNGELVGLEVDARTKASKPEPKPEPESIEDHQFTEDQKDRILSWATETDEKGNALRPWADPTHPRHKTALSIAQGILEDFQNDMSMDLDKMLVEVDRAVTMTLNKPSRTSAPVLAGTEDHRGKKKEKGLSRDELIIANAMGLTPEQYAEAKKRVGQ